MFSDLKKKYFQIRKSNLKKVKKEVYIKMAGKLTEEQIREYRESFTFFDKGIESVFSLL